MPQVVTFLNVKMCFTQRSSKQIDRLEKWLHYLLIVELGKMKLFVEASGKPNNNCICMKQQQVQR